MDQQKKDVRGLAVVIIALVVVLVAAIVLLEIHYGILPYVDVPYSDTLRIALIVLLVIGIVWIALWMMGRLFEAVAYPRVKSYAQVRSVWKLISYTVWAVVLVILILLLVGDFTSVAVSIGLIGAALAFAMQKPILNVAGWIYISYHRMFRIGDRISIGDTKGYVVDIRLMHSELMEMGEWMEGDVFTGRIALVPNYLVFEGPVQNYTRDSPFIWDEVVNLVTYESDIKLAKEYMLEAAKDVVGDIMAQNYERYKSNLALRDLASELLMEPAVRMTLRDSGVDIYVMYWCPANLRRKVRTEITERIWSKFMEDPNIEIAYPHMEVVKHGRSWGESAPDLSKSKK